MSKEPIYINSQDLAMKVIAKNYCNDGEITVEEVLDLIKECEKQSPVAEIHYDNKVIKIDLDTRQYIADQKDSQLPSDFWPGKEA
jgi:hypothetical protein